MMGDSAQTDLFCQSDLHKSVKMRFLLVRVFVRKGAADRWLPANWCLSCLRAETEWRFPRPEGA